MLIMGEELVLVALDVHPEPTGGGAVLQVGLNAAGLAELAAGGQITLKRADGSPDVAVPPDATAVDDPTLGIIHSLILSAREGDRHPQRFVREWRKPTIHTYLERLRQNGVIDWDAPKNPKARYGKLHVQNAEAVAAARARLDRVANGGVPGGPGSDQRDLDFAAIVHAIGLGDLVYRGHRNRSRRDTLAAAVAKQRFAVLVTRGLPRRHDQKLTFDSSRDLQMSRDMIRAVTFDVHHSTGYDGGSHH